MGSVSMDLECDTCGETFDDAVDCWKCRQASTATLRAENARLREALEVVSKAETLAPTMREIARRALEEG